MVDVLGRDAGLGEAIRHGVSWKPGIMLLACEPLFLRRSDDFAVFDERGCTVVVKGRNAQNSHRRAVRFLKNRIDERRHRGALREHQEAAKDNHHDDDRHQPVLLARAHERPKLNNERHAMSPRTGAASTRAAAREGGGRSNSFPLWASGATARGLCRTRALSNPSA